MSYVKLNRALRDNPVASDPHYLAIWTWLLMLAAYKPHTVILQGSQIDLEAGQLATSIRILAAKSGVKRDKVFVILGLLERTEMIRRRATKKHTVITLVNWSKYQIEETLSGQERRREKKEKKK